ncbi:hypothetical protein D4Q76_01010 [archaeon]|nr:MAG: hypothetical protein D4Q76_01010 [archaeon]
MGGFVRSERDSEQLNEEIDSVFKDKGDVSYETVLDELGVKYPNIPRTKYKTRLLHYRRKQKPEKKKIV